MNPRILFCALALISSMPGLALAGDSLEIVVSIVPQRWLVEEIGGDRVAVEVLVAPGESPTTYLPTDSQVTHLMQAQVYFRAGVAFERGLWFDAVRKMGRFLMVDLREGIELRGDDPHIWLSPSLLAIQAGTVAEHLSQLDPNSSQMYEKNLQQLRGRLADLDRQIGELLRPFHGREFFVFHPSWDYFADAYGLHQVAIENSGREPSDQELTVLRATAREAKIKTIFVQPQIHGRGAEAFAGSVGANVEMLDPLAADVAANLLVTAKKLSAALDDEASDDP